MPNAASVARRAACALRPRRLVVAPAERPQAIDEACLVEDLDAERLGLFALAATTLAGDDERRLLADRARDLAAEAFDQRLHLVARPALQRAGDDDAQALERAAARGDLLVQAQTGIAQAIDERGVLCV